MRSFKRGPLFRMDLQLTNPKLVEPGLKQHHQTTREVGVGFSVLIVEEPILNCQGNNIYAHKQEAEK